MKKNIFKIIFFMLILFLLLVLLSFIFIPKDNNEEAGMKTDLNNVKYALYAEEKNTIDMLIIGDSESITSIIPTKLYKEYGYTSFSCGEPGQTLVDSIICTCKVNEKQDIKLVVLEANTIFVRASLTEPVDKISKEVLPIIQNHNRWKNLEGTDFFTKVDYKTKNNYKGYHPSKAILAADDLNYMDKEITREDSNKIPRSNQIYLKVLKKYCEDNNIKLMIVSTPSAKNWNKNKHKTLKQFTDKENIEFLDLNKKKIELNIDWKNDSRDNGDHLNDLGAIKVTKYFGEYLKNKNILEDHRNDPKYSEWDKLVQDTNFSFEN